MNNNIQKIILEVSFGAVGNGGVSNVIMSIIRSLHTEFQFDVLTFSKHIQVHDDEIRSSGGNVYCINCDWKGRWVRHIEFVTRPMRIFVKCLWLFNHKHYDVIHCHYADEGGVILLAAKICGIPIRIIHSHNTKSPLDRKGVISWYRGIQHFLGLKCSTSKIGCSQEACQAMFGDQKFMVINNALNLEQFETKERGKSSNNMRFVHVGRFAYQKNQLFLLDVFRSIVQVNNHASLVLVGWGADLEKIKERIRENGLESNVLLLPPDSNIAEVFSNADYMIFPSIFEGLGIVLLEAQVSGVYCFASSSIPRIVNIGLCTFLDLSLGAEEWGHKILEFINNGTCSRSIVNEEKKKSFDIQEVKKEYVKLYNGE